MTELKKRCDAQLAKLRAEYQEKEARVKAYAIKRANKKIASERLAKYTKLERLEQKRDANIEAFNLILPLREKLSKTIFVILRDNTIALNDKINELRAQLPIQVVENE